MNYLFSLHHGDCLEVMRRMPDNSVDSIVTDPPYGLTSARPSGRSKATEGAVMKGFMGLAWDGYVPGVDVWAECLRVLKPGGHLLAFAGTRTQHRMATRIEDAGFEIRDMIAWVYGSGFPKSLDVSKAIDKMDAAEEQERRRLAFTAWVRSHGVTSRQIDDATGTNMGGHYTTAASQPAIMTREHLEACRHLFRDVPQWVEEEADIRTVESRNMAEREVVDTEIRYNEASGIVSAGRDERTLIERKITVPHTESARQWQGWGTALKPALEPITVARKPLVGTVAANVLEHGTGALNIDGCRFEGVKAGGSGNLAAWRQMEGRADLPTPPAFDAAQGRWPANLIHDGAEPTDLLGEAARFFYCAKASKKDRDEGNAHPTVKPTDLMRYLCRLVTPPGGLVLDPFMGSGSTGKAAVLEGFGFIGCELSAEHLAIARTRIEAAIKPANDNRPVTADMLAS
jgi:DNA modification methylase